jgi:hypothetical protein
MPKPLEKITKVYTSKGPLKQSRFDKTISFKCFRCGQVKVSKLITIYNNDWDRRLCNGCYGALLSIHEIKDGTLSIDEKIEKLTEVLSKLVKEEDIRIQTKKINLQNNKSKSLNTKSLKFYATSECVAEAITKDPNLDWSCAIIGLCKAFETELIERIVNPLKRICIGLNLPENDLKDKDFGKVALYCAGKTIKSPELGVINHFISTVINSKERIEKSEFLSKGLKELLNKMPNNNWILDKTGLSYGIISLTNLYRNKAAHTDELAEFDYINCRELVFGKKGLIWDLIVSSETNRI